MPRPVLTKSDFVCRYALGEFGNASPTWNTFEEWTGRKVGSGTLYHIRNRVKGGATWYNVRSCDLKNVWEFASKKCGQCNLYISAMAPTKKTILQGEVQEGVWGLELTYTRVKKPMRDALREQSISTRGLEASLLLGVAMNDLSGDWLMYLLEMYPEHVVEFSVYSVCWGTVPGHNTVFWEVRKY